MLTAFFHLLGVPGRWLTTRQNLALIGEKDGSISGSDTDDSESEREDNEGGERETEEEEKGLPKRRKVLVQEIDNDKKGK